MPNVGQELLNVPFPEMVLKLALAIAEGQYALDLASCKIAALMGDKEKAKVTIPLLATGENYESSLIGAGFQPTFYQFTDTIIEVKMAISMVQSSDFSVSTTVGGGCAFFAASVTASYSQKYSYSVDGSSLLRTKITPVPPNAFMQALLDTNVKFLQIELDKKMELAKIETEKAKLKNDQATAKEEKALIEEKTTQEAATIKAQGEVEAEKKASEEVIEAVKETVKEETESKTEEKKKDLTDKLKELGIDIGKSLAKSAGGKLTDVASGKTSFKDAAVDALKETAKENKDKLGSIL